MVSFVLTEPTPQLKCVSLLLAPQSTVSTPSPSPCLSLMGAFILSSEHPTSQVGGTLSICTGTTWCDFTRFDEWSQRQRDLMTIGYSVLTTHDVWCVTFTHFLKTLFTHIYDSCLPKNMFYSFTLGSGLLSIYKMCIFYFTTLQWKKIFFKGLLRYS